MTVCRYNWGFRVNLCYKTVCECNSSRPQPLRGKWLWKLGSYPMRKIEAIYSTTESKNIQYHKKRSIFNTIVLQLWISENYRWNSVRLFDCSGFMHYIVPFWIRVGGMLTAVQDYSIVACYNKTRHLHTGSYELQRRFLRTKLSKIAM